MVCVLAPVVFSGFSCAFERCMEIKAACVISLLSDTRMCLCWHCNDMDEMYSDIKQDNGAFFSIQIK